MAGAIRSDPFRGASKLAGRSKRVNRGSPEIQDPREADCGSLGSAEPLSSRRRPMSTSLHWNLSMFELPGVVEDSMPGRNGQRKPGTARGSPRRSRTAKASRISRTAAKSRCACERGGWGRISDDGPGHYNPVSSEGPWGDGDPISWWCTIEPTGPTQSGAIDAATRCTKDGRKLGGEQRMPGAGLS